LLEIGCGGAGLRNYAAKRMARRWSADISKEQRDFAQERIQNAGHLADKVNPAAGLSRPSATKYDRIASIEMIEASASQFWPKLFLQLRERMLPGGIAGIKSSTIKDRLFPDLHAAKSISYSATFFPAECFPRRKC